MEIWKTSSNRSETPLAINVDQGMTLILPEETPKHNFLEITIGCLSYFISH